MMDVRVTQIITIQDDEMDRIFKARLRELTRGYWVSEGKVMAEGYTSHWFDYVVAKDCNDPKFAVEVAAYHLLSVLK